MNNVEPNSNEFVKIMVKQITELRKDLHKYEDFIDGLLNYIDSENLDVMDKASEIMVAENAGREISFLLGRDNELTRLVNYMKDNFYLLGE